MHAMETWTVAAMLVALAATTCASLLPGAGRSLPRRTHPAPARATKLTRLPLEVLPQEYVITITPYFQAEGDFQANQFQGHVVIFATVNGAVSNQTDTITLHAAKTLELENDTLRIWNQKETSLLAPIVVKSVNHDNVSETATIQLTKQVSGVVVIEITYTGQLAEDMDGFYVSTYQANGENRYLAVTQFKATSARKAFPCFDEPAVKAKFFMIINPPEGYGALFNMEPDEETTLSSTSTTSALKSASSTESASKEVKNMAQLRRLLAERPSAGAAAGRTPVSFQVTKPMSTYLLAFVVYHLETFSALERNATDLQGPVRVWSREDLAGQRGYALEVAAAALDAYGQLFPDYFRRMNSKMDQVAVPDFSAGAMENWGLVTYRESEVLIDEAESTTEARRSVVTTVAHELAHQWFGDLVSPDFWNVLWLSEGFATYWSYHADLGSSTEGWRLRDQFLAEEMTAALEADSAGDTHRLTTRKNTMAPFDDITYRKGGCILRMFSSWIGEDEFYRGLNTYLTAHNFSSAQPADLFMALAPKDEQLRRRMALWTSAAGYPVVTVTRNGTQVQLKQEIYQLTPSDGVQIIQTRPILLSFNNGSRIWMLNRQMDLTVSLQDEEPLFLNYKWTGFYRVNYDTAGWRGVQSQLMSEHLVVPRETRAQLVSDVFSLARSDHLDYSLAWDLSAYLPQEEDYLPWAVAFRAFDFLDTALAPTTYYSSFKTYMQRLLEQPYATVRFEVLPDDDHVTRLHRVNMLRHACRFGHPPCVQAASDLAAQTFPTDGQQANRTDPDLRSAVYCEWAQDQSLWDSLWQRYQDTSVATEKVELLSALGCSQDSNQLNQYLTNALDANLVRPQDWATVFAGVYSTPFGLQVATEFIRNNAAKLATQPSVLQRIINGLAEKVVTNDQLDKLRSLSSVTALEAVNATLQSAISTAQQQVSWADAHVPLIGAWLDNEVHVSAALSIMVGSWTVHLVLGAIGCIMFSLLSDAL